MQLTGALREEYDRLWATCQIDPTRAREVERAVTALAANAARYVTVSGAVGVPWYVVAVIHNMEAGQRFDYHLHNGDPLTARTRQVPAGRPPDGAPPFIWEVSAVDALRFDRMDRWSDWGVAGTLYKLEGFNGWGYRRHHPEVLSPYLWSVSNHYRRGKYVADGRWSPTARSTQIGAAVLLRRMAERALIAFGVATPTEPPTPDDLLDAAPLITYWTGGREVPGARALQEFLNRLPGIAVKVDGKPGERTSTAVKRVLGRYLRGDPRDDEPA